MRRRGKLLMLDTDGPVLGLRFGMTGRLVVDGGMPIVGLEYGPDRTDPAWRRFGLPSRVAARWRWTMPAGSAASSCGPTRRRSGPTPSPITRRQLASALVRGEGADQGRAPRPAPRRRASATSWPTRSCGGPGIDPARAAGTLADDEVSRLHRTIRRVLPQLMAGAAATRATCRWPASGAPCAHGTGPRWCGAPSAGARRTRAPRTSCELCPRDSCPHEAEDKALVGGGAGRPAPRAGARGSGGRGVRRSRARRAVPRRPRRPCRRPGPLRPRPSQTPRRRSRSRSPACRRRRLSRRRTSRRPRRRSPDPQHRASARGAGTPRPHHDDRLLAQDQARPGRPRRAPPPRVAVRTPGGHSRRGGRGRSAVGPRRGCGRRRGERASGRGSGRGARASSVDSAAVDVPVEARAGGGARVGSGRWAAAAPTCRPRAATEVVPPAAPGRPAGARVDVAAGAHAVVHASGAPRPPRSLAAGARGGRPSVSPSAGARH